MSEDEALLEQPEDEVSQQVKFTYIKSNLFRVVHVDVVLGAITPTRGINMNFCSERFSIPREIVYEVNEDGLLGEEILEKRVQRDSVVREVEVATVMDLETAKQLLLWLKDLVDKAEAERD